MTMKPTRLISPQNTRTTPKNTSVKSVCSVGKYVFLLTVLVLPAVLDAQTLYAPGGTIGTSSTANVGIGTSSPSQALTINGNLYLTGSPRAIIKDANTRLDFFNAGGMDSTNPLWQGYHFTMPDTITYSGAIVYPRVAMYWNYNSASNLSNLAFNYYLANTGGLPASLMFGTESAGNIDFLTAGLYRFRITSSGNVGIGTFSPQANLEIQGGSAALRIGNYVSGSGNAQIQFTDFSNGIIDANRGLCELQRTWDSTRGDFIRLSNGGKSAGVVSDVYASASVGFQYVYGGSEK